MWDILKWMLYVVVVVILGFLVRLAFEAVRLAMAERAARQAEANKAKAARDKRVAASKKAA